MKRLLLLALLIGGAAHAQTNQVWSCLSNCNLAGDTYNDGAWRAPTPTPTYVAATNGTNTNCATNWWNRSGAVRWRRPVDLAANHCVAYGSTNGFVTAASRGWPPSTTPTPVDCVVSAWSEWTGPEWSACSLTNGRQTRTETRSRTVVTPASNGGLACPALSETRAAEQSCQMPAPSAVLTISSNQVLVGESITVSWLAVNAASCSSTWTPANQETPLSGNNVPIGPFMFPQNVEIGITCRSFFGEYGATMHVLVTPPPPKSPPCWPHAEDLFAAPPAKAHLQWAFLDTTGTRYSIKATWFCATPTGPVQETWATTILEVLKRAALEQNGGTYDEADAASQCEAECEVIPAGPLKDELDAFAAQYTVEQLGVID